MWMRIAFLGLAMAAGALSNASEAGAQSAALNAHSTLVDLEQTVRANAKPRQISDFLQLAKLFREAGDPARARQLLQDAEVLVARRGGPPWTWRYSVAKEYGELNDLQAITRLMPNENWVRTQVAEAAILAGDQAALERVLADKYIHLLDKDNAVALFLPHVIEKGGIAAALAFLDEMQIKHPIGDEESPRLKAAKVLIKAALRSDQFEVIRSWAIRADKYYAQAFEQSLPEIAIEFDESGDPRQAEFIVERIQEPFTYLSALGNIAIARIKRGDSQYAAAIAQRLLSDGVRGIQFDQAVEKTWAGWAHTVTDKCRGPSKRRPALDEHWSYVRSGFIDCSPRSQDPLLLAFGYELSKAGRDEGRAVLAAYEKFVRSDKAAPDGETGICAGLTRSLGLNSLYREAGAKAVVDDYTEEYARTCESEPQEHDALQLSILFGLIKLGATAENLGATAEIRRQLERIGDKVSALTYIHWGIRSRLESGKRQSAQELLDLAADALRTNNLFMRRAYDDENYPRLGPMIIEDHMDAGYGNGGARLLVETTEQMLSELNLRPTRKNILAFASLYLAALQLGVSHDPAEFVARISSVEAREDAYAFCIEALALIGRTDAAMDAVKLAAERNLTPEEAYQIANRTGVYPFFPASHAWASIGKAFARRGDLIKGYTLAAMDRNSGISLEALASAWRESFSPPSTK